MAREIIKALDRQVIAPFLQKSNHKAWLMLGANYGLIFGAFAMAVLIPSLITYMIVLVLLANRQLGLAILMHDTTHQALFRSSRLNSWVGRWLCAAPVLADWEKYRLYHLDHHRTAGSAKDPDRSNYINYPVGRESLLRKTLRDFSGMTGIKTLGLIWKMNTKSIAYQLSYAVKPTNEPLYWWQRIGNGLWGLRYSIIYYAVFLWVCASLDLMICFGLWWLAFLSPYMWISRIRNASEHAVTKNTHSLDPLLNTRTTRANLIERLIFAPNFVNYHLEHHLLPNVPPYNLKKLHEMLHAEGYLKPDDITDGYLAVIQILIGDTAIKCFDGAPA